MKKLIAVSLSLVMAAGVMAGCNSEAAKETEETKAEETTTVEESEKTEESSEETVLESEDTEVTDETEADDDRIVPNKPFEPTPEPTEPAGLVKKEVVFEGKEQSGWQPEKSVYEYEDGVLVKLTYDGYRYECGYEYQKVTEYEYDGGKLIKETSTFDNGKVNIADYEHDGDLLMSKIVKDSDGNLVESTFYTYDDGKLIEEDYTIEDEIIDEASTTLGYNVVTTYYYDEMGYEIKHVEVLTDIEHAEYTSYSMPEIVRNYEYYYDEDGKLVKFISEDDMEYTYEYDEQGNVVKEYLSWLSMGGSKFETDKEYDEKGRPVKAYSPDSNDDSVEEWTYEEDSEGRITKIVYSNSGYSETTTYYYE